MKVLKSKVLKKQFCISSRFVVLIILTEKQCHVITEVPNTKVILHFTPYFRNKT